MKKIKFKKRQLELFYSMLSFDLFKWQQNAIWQFFKDNKDEFHLVAPRQNGKSQILVVIALILLLIFDKKITFTSHMVKSCDDFYKKVKYELENNKSFNKRIKKTTNQKGAQSIELKSGAKIEFIARSKQGGIGDSNDVIIFDEFQMLNEEQMSAIFPTLAARPNSVTIYAGTSPRTVDDDAFYRNQRELHYSSDKWCEFGIGSEYDFEYLKKNDLFLDKKLLKRVNPSYEVMIPYENIVREFGKMDKLDFAIQRLGLFHTLQNKAVFGLNAINKVLINREEAQQFKGKYVLGIKFGIKSHCAVIAAKKDGVIYLEVLGKKDNKNGFEWLTKYIMESRKKSTNLKGVMVDGMFKEMLRQAVRTKVYSTYKILNNNDFLASQSVFESDILTSKIKIANQSSITSDLQNVSWKEVKEYSKFAPLNEGTDVVVVEAMAIANYYAKGELK